MYADPDRDIVEFLEARFQISLDQEAEALVPLLEYGLFQRLAEVALRELRAHPGKLDLLLLDASLLQIFQEAQEPLPEATFVGCLTLRETVNGGGTTASAMPQAGNAAPVHRTPCTLPATMRVLLLLSASHALLLVGEIAVDSQELRSIPRTFTGVWTADRTVAMQVAQGLIGERRPDVLRAATQASVSLDAASPELTQLLLRMMRVQATVQLQRQQAIANENADLFYVLNALYTISPYDKAHDVLYHFVQQVTKVVAADRCSVVQIATSALSEEDHRAPECGVARDAYVLASHEDSFCDGLPLDLAKYPELRQALAQRKRICLNPVPARSIAEESDRGTAHAPFSAVLVFPMLWEDPHIGTLFLRVARRHGAYEAREIRFLEVLAEAAGNALAHAQLFRNMHQTNLKLEHLSRTDGLTGLYNYRHLIARFEEELKRAQRYRLPLSFMLFDIDDFKQFNDSFGHLVGDEVLRELALRTRQAIRQSDCIARYGGEEFAIILPHTPLAGARKQAERLRRQVTDSPFYIHGAPYAITISVGVSGVTQGAVTTCAAVMEAADEALYRAKSAGKNRVCGPRSIESS